MDEIMRTITIGDVTWRYSAALSQPGIFIYMCTACYKGDVSNGTSLLENCERHVYECPGNLL